LLRKWKEKSLQEYYQSKWWWNRGSNGYGWEGADNGMPQPFAFCSAAYSAVLAHDTDYLS